MPAPPLSLPRRPRAATLPSQSTQIVADGNSTRPGRRAPDQVWWLLDCDLGRCFGSAWSRAGMGYPAAWVATAPPRCRPRPAASLVLAGHCGPQPSRLGRRLLAAVAGALTTVRDATQRGTGRPPFARPGHGNPRRRATGPQSVRLSAGPA